jgi:hypothetical protein
MSTTVENLQDSELYELIFACQTPEEKKAVLIQLSEEVKFKIELGETEEETVNGGLIELYSNKEHKEFDTFHGWKKRGFKIKKGSKCFFVWTKPIKSKDKKENQKEEKEEPKEYKFFKMAYLFSNAQIEEFKKPE